MLSALSAKKPNYEQPATLIAKDTTIESTLLKAKSSIQVNGILNGNIECSASVVIGQTGKVTGNVDAEFLLVAGTIEGKVNVKNQLHMNKTANILGDIQCGSIIVDDGAVLNGQLSMSGETKVVKDNPKNQKSS